MNFRIRNLVSERETGGDVSVFAEVTAPGFGPPLHSHRSQIEVFHIIQGQHLFRLGDQQITAGPGDCVVVPAGVAHAFKKSIRPTV